MICRLPSDARSPGGRFRSADLELPATIRIDFSTDRSDCDHAPGRCRPDREPPSVLVCQPSGDTRFLVDQRRTTLLHELAHLWHRSLEPGTWADLRPQVAGRDRDDIEMVERVAETISWGLLETVRRPVGSDVPCDELYDGFVRLTGGAPLGTVALACRPVSG